MQRKTMGCLLLAWGFLAVSAQADNWPRFRGPNGTGVSADKDVPIKWTAKNELWKTAIPGIGNSSPVVWGDKVFLQTSPTEKTRSLVCISAGEGKILWTKSIKASDAHTHRRNTLSSSSPCVDAERVYVYFWDGDKIGIHAYDHNGKPLWQQPLGAYKSQHGPGHSPAVYEGKVIVADDQDGKARLVALDAKTGKMVWQTPRQAFRASYSTPFLHESAGRKELITCSSAGVAGYDPDTGKELWSYTWTFDKMPMRTVASPVFAQGIVVASSGDGSGARHAIAVKKGDKGDVTSTNLAWENKRAKSFPYVPTMLVKGDYLYGVNDFGFAKCIVAKTGKEVYSERLGSAVSASPVMINNNIYVCGEDGNVYVYPADPKFKLLAKNSLNDKIMASPAIANNRLFIRTGKHLVCIGPE